MAWLDLVELLVDCFNLRLRLSFGLPLFKSIWVVNCLRVDEVIIHVLLLVRVCLFWLHFLDLPWDVEGVSLVKLSFEKSDEL